ncbi:MAG: DUF5798 family protein [Halobacteriaceae archaeon]
MGFGSTAKKVQKLADTAEKLYGRLDEVRQQVVETRKTVNDSNERLRELEREMAAQRAVLDAIAEDHDVDVAAVRDEVSADAESESGTAD